VISGTTERTVNRKQIQKQEEKELEVVKVQEEEVSVVVVVVVVVVTPFLKLHNKKLSNLCSPPNISSVIKSSRMKLVGYVSHMGQ
jgi:hypothetical protein